MVREVKFFLRFFYRTSAVISTVIGIIDDVVYLSVCLYLRLSVMLCYNFNRHRPIRSCGFHQTVGERL